MTGICQGFKGRARFADVPADLRHRKGAVDHHLLGLAEAAGQLRVIVTALDIRYVVEYENGQGTPTVSVQRERTHDVIGEVGVDRRSLCLQQARIRVCFHRLRRGGDAQERIDLSDLAHLQNDSFLLVVLNPSRVSVNMQRPNVAADGGD